MRNFWVKRGEWVIGPVTEQQIRQMAQQQWFRESDQIGKSESGPWAEARSVVPAGGFNAELTAQRESLLEPAAPTGNPRSSDERVRSRDKVRPYAHRGRDFQPHDSSAPESDSPPVWFRRGDRNRTPRASEVTDRAAADESHLDFEISPEADDGVADHSLEPIDFPMDGPGVSEDISASSPLVDDLFGGVTPQAETESAGRFHTAEFDVAAADDHTTDTTEGSDRSRADSRRRTSSGDWNFDLATGLAAAGEDSGEFSHSRKNNSDALPDEFEVDVPHATQRKPVTDWELVIGDLDSDDQGGAGADVVAREAAPFELSVHSLRTGKALSAAESAASAELDFVRLANMAAADPAMSRSELSTAPANEPTPSLITPEERDLRRTIGGDLFQTQLSILCLTIGLQSCALSAVVNGLVYVALRRFFLLATETFFPWGTGSLEVLEGADLALAGTAMAITFALPFLALSYLIRVDGRVNFYLISLGVALIPAIMIGSGAMNAAGGKVFVCLLLAAPAVVSAVVSGLLAMRSAEQVLKQLLAAGAGAAVLVATSIFFASPRFGIDYLLRELPPELQLRGGLIYAAMLFYSVQLTLLYFVLRRIAKACLDESTQDFVDQHMLFHWMLTATAFVLVGVVHGEVATGWGTAPILLGGLTAVVSLGFNLWSLVSHLEPRLDRLRIED